MAVKQTVIGQRPTVTAAATGIDQQARQRIELGKELLSAAEAYSARQAAAVEALRKDQAQLRDEVQREVSQSLRSYDQTVADLEQRLTTRMDEIQRAVEALDGQWRQAHEMLFGMVRRCEALLDQSRVMLERGAPSRGAGKVQRPIRPDSAARTATPASPPAPREVPPAAAPPDDDDAPPPLIYTQAVELLRGKRPQGV